MSDDTNIDDLFGDDAPKPAKPARKPRSTKQNIEVRTTIRGGGKVDGPDIVAVDEPIDNAVRIRRLDWECECGNTNTLDLRLCGKCRKPRFTN